MLLIAVASFRLNPALILSGFLTLYSHISGQPGLHSARSDFQLLTCACHHFNRYTTDSLSTHGAPELVMSMVQAISELVCKSKFSGTPHISGIGNQTRHSIPTELLSPSSGPGRVADLPMVASFDIFDFTNDRRGYQANEDNLEGQLPMDCSAEIDIEQGMWSIPPSGSACVKDGVGMQGGAQLIPSCASTPTNFLVDASASFFRSSEFWSQGDESMRFPS